MKIFDNTLNLYKKTDPLTQKIIFLSAIISMLVFTSYTIQQPENFGNKLNERFVAAGIMEMAIKTISEHCAISGIPIDTILDPNKTGLIGREYTGLTTTLGQLEAKRTSTNPEMAALIVDLLVRADVSAGDKVALGCSGSFPGLMIASLAACKAMQVEPVIILSLGSSSFGANHENFTILDIYDVLYNEGFFYKKPDAISLGGSNDTGDEFEPSLRKNLINRIKENEILFIDEPDLQKNVAVRMDIYKKVFPEKHVKAFINAGGNLANMGTSELILNLEPGLNTQTAMPDESLQGVIHKMVQEKTPVIHLLYLKELVMSSGVMWDPVPLSDLKKSSFLNTNDQSNKMLLPVTIIYFVMLIGVVFYYKNH